MQNQVFPEESSWRTIDDSLSGNEESGGEQSVGFAALNATAKFGFFPAGKELSVFSLQSSSRSCRGAWKGARVAWVDAGELPLAPTFGHIPKICSF